MKIKETLAKLNIFSQNSNSGLLGSLKKIFEKPAQDHSGSEDADDNNFQESEDQNDNKIMVTEEEEKEASNADDTTNLEDIADETEAPANEIKTRTMSFSKLKDILDTPTFNYESLIEQGKEYISFPELFKLTKITEESANVNRLAEFIQHKEIRLLSDKEKQNQIKAIQIYNKINIEDLCLDALKKDQALDSYEVFIVNRTKRAVKELESEITVLKQELQNKDIKESEAQSKQALIQTKERTIAERRNSCNKWLQEKTAMELSLAEVCRLLGKGNNMTIGLVTEGKEGRSQIKNTKA